VRELLLSGAVARPPSLLLEGSRPVGRSLLAPPPTGALCLASLAQQAFSTVSYNRAPGVDPRARVAAVSASEAMGLAAKAAGAAVGDASYRDLTLPD